MLDGDYFYILYQSIDQQFHLSSFSVNTKQCISHKIIAPILVSGKRQQICMEPTCMIATTDRDRKELVIGYNAWATLCLYEIDDGAIGSATYVEYKMEDRNYNLGVHECYSSASWIYIITNKRQFLSLNLETDEKPSLHPLCAGARKAIQVNNFLVLYHFMPILAAVKLANEAIIINLTNCTYGTARFHTHIELTKLEVIFKDDDCILTTTDRSNRRKISLFSTKTKFSEEMTALRR